MSTTETASQFHSLEEYLEYMHPWIKRILRIFTRKGSVMCDMEEMLQEAQIPLIEVYMKYADAKPKGELGRLGSQAMYNHVAQLVTKSQARGAGDAVMLSFEDDIVTGVETEGLYDSESLAQTFTPLDSMIVRETVESVLAASDDAREVVSIELGRSRDRATKLRATSLFASGRSAIYSNL